MRKIIIAFDGTQYSEAALNFARLLNEKEPIYLAGLFLPQLIFANLWSYAEAATGHLFVPLVEGDDSAIIEKNIDRFQRFCNSNKIAFKVHKDFYDFALPELTKESRFADLLILGSESFYQNMGTEDPNEYLKEALHIVKCPVLLVPEKFEFPSGNILACDGGEASIYAIKQFAYLFPEFQHNKTLIVTLPPKDKAFLENEPYIKELTSAHFPDNKLLKLEVDADKYFSSWASEMQASVLVAGSYGRSFISQLFKHSFVNEVIRDHRVPVFIAHH